MSEMISILIGADIVPTTTNIKEFENADKIELIGEELSNLFASADYSILNLEAPITNLEAPITKCGPNLIIPEKAIHGLKAINANFYTLANNHVLDQGAAGLLNTIDILDSEGISYAGAGKDLMSASVPFKKEIRRKKIGIYCCAEHEFSIATDISPGANPYDPLVSFDHVRKLKEECCYVIVLYHGGIEQYRYPSPLQQRIFRRFAEAGADLVVSQHTHCVGCMEEYKNATLVYGQGNFLFDGYDNEFWNNGLLLRICISFETTTLEFIPIIKKGNSVRLANDLDRKDIMDGFYSRSEYIKDEINVKKQFVEYAKSQENMYYRRISGAIGEFLPIKGINKLLGGKLIKKIYPPKALVAIENCLDCESHRELFLEAIKRYRV